MNNLKDKIDALLMKVSKPTRYTGGELNSSIKNPEKVKVRFAFAFPDVYEVGMSHLGLRILYHLLNRREDVYCERVFAPWLDMEKLMKENDIPLFSLETKTPLDKFDFIGFTLQYELSYTNVINMLNLADIPILSREREGFPFVIAGGPCAYNPAPLSEVIDFFVMGEGEEVINEIIDAYIDWKERKGGREEFLQIASQIKGVYVPKYYMEVYNQDGTIKEIRTIKKGVPEKVKKRIVKDFENVYHPEEQIVPFMDVVHDRIMLEIFRGCTRGCRFCQAGMIYRPVREKSIEKILDLADKLVKSTGYEEISLASLSTCDYSQIEELVKRLIKKYKDKGVGVSIPSTRVDAVSINLLKEIQKVRKTGLTLAPEAGTQRLRDVINKGITEEDILEATKEAFSAGWTNVKLYFMVGLPTETMEDVKGIVDLAYKIVDNYKEVKGNVKNLRVTISTSTFVPKPFTPFQWTAQDSIKEIMEKQDLLKKKLKSKVLKYNWHNPYMSFLEAVISRGDRKVGKAIIKAWEKGCRFDGWEEYFNYDKWEEAFKEVGVNPHFYANRERNLEEIFPWDVIDVGVDKRYLMREYKKSQEGRITPDCRLYCTGCGIKGFDEGVVCFEAPQKQVYKR
ncbi:Radical SAM domain protein [Thermoanaerobacter italicus Ab9]|uniref:Radical SAM domain protein n=1 Tax=Thermoanaerobacter italicus (strain DSM 9252 / Ab9) TaxID=580331 RepID=D3T841_THEIA|nr:TIGR03960 family B12-binding radical SAM protein [Thermoanaerobacter italicus]ADD02123.1 Radical SAM domain protein [Thermoanaerobacter italicus Ab9]